VTTPKGDAMDVSSTQNVPAAKRNAYAAMDANIKKPKISARSKN
jgi:hypothetical protein